MPRFINAFNAFTNTDGSVNSGGFVNFFKAGTSSPLTTFADNLLTIPNSNPVVLDAAGRLPNVFYEGSAKIIITNSSGGDTQERDPVGGENVTGDFALYDNLITYDLNDIVEGSDNLFYISLSNGNQGNDPVTPSPTKWSEFRLIGVFNSQQSYSVGVVVQDTDGFLWRSIVSSNLGNVPNLDSGANWQPAIDGAKIPALTTVIPHTGGGTLTALRTNELRDANTGYLLPLANSVGVNQTIRITLPVRYPIGAIVTRSGSDTIEGLASDTSITFAGPTPIELTSDGVSTWTI